MRSALVLLAATLVLLGSAAADAKHVQFLGPHPIAARYGGGYCYIEAPHLHIYSPDHAALYQQVDGGYVFTADPTPFGYDGDRHLFYGHHPIVVAGASEPVFCFLDGPHSHPFAPPDDGAYKIKKGVAFYVAAPPPAYVQLAPHRTRVVNAEYRPFAGDRPVVEVEPPPDWRGVVVAAPGVTVRAPGAVVAAPAVEVDVRAPGVVVGAPPGVVVGAPPGVVVGAPPRVMVGAPGVVVGAPGVVVGSPGVVVEERREHEHEHGGHEHHDNGRHRGWGR